MQLLFKKSKCSTSCINIIKFHSIWFSPFQLIHITSNLDSAMQYIFYSIQLCVICSFVSVTSVWFYETLCRPLARTESPDISLKTSFLVGIDSLNNLLFNKYFILLSNLSKYTIIDIIFHVVHKSVMRNFAKMLCLQHFCLTDTVSLLEKKRLLAC